MLTVERITLAEDDLAVVDGPLYEEQGEDGPYTRYDYFVVYRDREAKALTLSLSFSLKSEAELAKGAFEDGGVINVENWDKGDPWIAYHQGMTLEERWAPHGEAWQQEQNERNGW